MTHDPNELVSRYFDDALTSEEHQVLQDWLRSSSDHVREFTQLALLHDHLRGEQLAMSLLDVTQPNTRDVGSSVVKRPRRSIWISLGVAMALIATLMVLLDVGKSPVAAATELKRLIAAQEEDLDRTYRIAVEEVAMPRRDRPSKAEAARPPKPPLDGAILHVRKGNQFVLIRSMSGDRRFVTGSNGQTSWAVRPDGPVRVSADLTRFNRDLPGHEHDFPLIQIERGLVHLRDAYDIQLLPIENGDDAVSAEVPTRLLVAVKKRGYRGPQRVEITYVVRTGEIRQLRFVEMPYGPEHLTVRLTLEEERPLGPLFFDHESHHESNRVVEEE